MEWNGVRELSIQFAHGPGQDCNIYGNALNRIAVLVRLQPSDNGEPIPADVLSDDEVRKAITLIDYLDETDVSYRDGSDADGQADFLASLAPDWYYCREENEFTAIPDFLPEVRQATARDSGVRIIRFHVYTSHRMAGKIKSIAVRVKPTNGDPVSTSLGKSEASFVRFTSKAPVSYSAGGCRYQALDWEYPSQQIAGSDSSGTYQYACKRFYISPPSDRFSFIKSVPLVKKSSDELQWLRDDLLYHHNLEWIWEFQAPKRSKSTYFFTSYAWNIGDREGDVDRYKLAGSGNWEAKIPISPKNGAFEAIMVREKFVAPIDTNNWYSKKNFGAKFVVFDQFGNSLALKLTLQCDDNGDGSISFKDTAV